MTPAELVTILAKANLAAAGAVLLVLFVRPLLARAFGARVRYSAWAVVPMAVVVGFLPAPVAKPLPALSAAMPPAVQTVFASPPAITQPLPVADTVVETTVHAVRAATPVDWSAWAVALWLGGVLSGLALMALRQRHFARKAKALGPAVVGFIRPRIHLPEGFETAFPPAQRRLILAHETVHLVRQDARINGAVSLLQCLNWFNPFVHVAAFYFRIDQEAACDEAVIAAHPNNRRDYAEALLKTQLAAAPLPLGCYWPARASKPLEDRIAMLKRKAPSRRRLACGAASIAVIAVATGYTAWAAQSPQPAASAPAPLIGGPVSQGLTTAQPDGAGVSVGGMAQVAAQAGAVADSNAQTIEEAIAAGDIQRIMALGGRPTDVLAAMRILVARDPAARLVPGSTDTRNLTVAETLQAMDRYEVAGFVPVFMNDGTNTLIGAQRRSDGVTLRTFAAGGMNSPGAPLLGERYAPTRDQQQLATNNRMVIEMPLSLEEAIAAGSLDGIRLYGGNMMDYVDASIAQQERSKANALAQGNAAAAAQAQQMIDSRKMDQVFFADEYRNGSPGAYIKPPTTLEELTAQRTATTAAAAGQ